MLYVITLKDPTHVAVKMDIRVMAKAVLVIFFYVHFLIMCFTHVSILEKCFFRLNACNLWLSWGKGHSTPFFCRYLQMLMNVSNRRQTSVIRTLSVTTLKDPTLVAVLLDIRAMVKTAQVNIYLLRRHLLCISPFQPH